MSWLDAAEIKHQLISVLPLAFLCVSVRVCASVCVCVRMCGFQLVTVNAKSSLVFNIMTIS